MTEVTLKTDVEEYVSNDPYYDLFEGGYINPKQFLEEESAQKVREAMNIVKEFISLLEEEELLILC